MNVKVLLTTALIYSLAGCGSESNDSTTDASVPVTDMAMLGEANDGATATEDTGITGSDARADTAVMEVIDAGLPARDLGGLKAPDMGASLPADGGATEMSCLSDFEGTDLYGMSARSLTRGEVVPMCDFEGEALLFVNTAANCGFTPQFEALEELHRQYRGRPLRVLGFLSNDFGNQGGSLEEVQQCTDQYMVTFEQFLHVGVTSNSRDGQHPVFGWLTTQSLSPGDIPWNFSKFLVSYDGELIGRWTHQVAPDDGAFLTAVEAAVNRAQLAQ